MENKMKTCKTCLFWSDDRTRICNFVDLKSYQDPQQFEIIANVDAFLKTGPDFGCVLHQEKTPVPVALKAVKRQVPQHLIDEDKKFLNEQ